MKKYLKRILYSIIVFVVIILIAIPIYISYWRNSSTLETFNSLTEKSGISFAGILWNSQFIGNEKVEKISFYVPVKIKGLKGNLVMQFDSGQQRTIIYGKTLDELIKSGQTVEFIYNKDSIRYLKNPILSIGDTQLKSDKLRVVSKYGTSEIDTSKIVIGTLGFDTFVNRTLVLDFKRDQLAITEKESKTLDYDLEYIDNASVDKFPLLIPARIGNRSTKLFYDTGSSMFPLLTSNKRLNKINENKRDSMCCISNWGRQLPVFRKKLNAPIEIGNNSYNNQYIYGNEALNMVDYLPSWYIFGMTGNRLFNDKVLVIDTRNNKFGVEN